MSNFFETVEKIFHDWHYDHPRILYAMMRSLKPKVAVEVGTYRGYAACYMARALQENEQGHLYCMDNFCEKTQKAFPDPVQHWKDNLEACGVLGWASLVVGNSDGVVWPAQVDFAYIDGWHGYLSCKRDFDNCAERGAEVICLDDVTGLVGPRMVLRDIRESGQWDVCEIHRNSGLGICTRRGPKSALTYSQELPHSVCWGKELTGVSRDELQLHLAQAAELNGVDYSRLEL